MWSLPTSPASSGIILPHHSDLHSVPKTHHVQFHYMAFQHVTLLCLECSLFSPTPSTQFTSTHPLDCNLNSQVVKKTFLESLEWVIRSLLHTLIALTTICICIFICQVPLSLFVSSKYSMTIGKYPFAHYCTLSSQSTVADIQQVLNKQLLNEWSILAIAFKTTKNYEIA